MSQNDLHKLEDKLFGHLGNLNTLNLCDNLLVKINNHTFNGLRNLQTLYLCANKLSYLDKSLFTNILFLRGLDLKYNMIRDIKFVEVLNFLEYLDLSGNVKIESFSKNTNSELVNRLYVSKVSNDFVRKIEFNNFQYMTQLDLSFNDLINFKQV